MLTTPTLVAPAIAKELTQDADDQARIGRRIGGQVALERLELDRHGMVITDAGGELLWKESGHKQTEAGVTKAIQQVLGR